MTVPEEFTLPEEFEPYFAPLDQFEIDLIKEMTGKAPMNQLTFEQLRMTNADRCNLWHDGFPDDAGWSVSDWSNAMGGELGEVAEAVEILVLDQFLSSVGGHVLDTVKKIRRDDDDLDEHNFDQIISNSGTIEDLAKSADAVMAEILEIS